MYDCDGFRKEAARYDFGDYEIIGNGGIEETLEKVMGTAGEGEVVLVMGSFYVMPETRKFFGFDEELDECNMNEGSMLKK